jgi:TrmH family RNA methyltransferase
MIPSQYHHVEARHNERFKRVAKLADSGKERRREKRIVLEGVHLIQAYAESFGSQDLELYVTVEALKKTEVGSLAQTLHPRQVTVFSHALISELALVDNPSGIVAVAPTPSVTPVGDLHSSELWVVLEGVQDPGNMGSIFRTAAASGAGRVVLSRGCADPWSPKCLRGGMGAQFLIPLMTAVSIGEALNTFRGRILATVPRGGASVYGMDLRGNLALLFGGEGDGLSEDALGLALERVSLPMRKGVESINLAAAVAACCFERTRQLQSEARG